MSPTLLLRSILRMLLKASARPSLFVPAECCMLNSGNVFLITSGGHAGTQLRICTHHFHTAQKNESSPQDRWRDAGLKLVKKANTSPRKPLSEHSATLIIDSIMSLTLSDKALPPQKTEKWNSPAAGYTEGSPAKPEQIAGSDVHPKMTE